MRIRYDPEADDVDALAQGRNATQGSPEGSLEPKHLGEGIAADYDAEGRLAGIEILDAVKRLGNPEVFRQVILEDVALRTA